jgi:uroporphyrinogen decarboxylase
MMCKRDRVTVARQQRRLMAVFDGRTLAPPPIWLMRQAGRYLPEYRELRDKVGSFLELCYTPALAAEATLQPLRRFAFDAAIVFADILVVPDALGQAVDFAVGDGPRLDPLNSIADLARLNPTAAEKKFAIVAETVARVRQDLPDTTSLIGFCGGPFTVASYMIGGRSSTDQARARLFAYRDPDGFKQVIDLLVVASVAYLSAQIAAGADLVQIFDSWAGSLPEDEFHRWVIGPTQAIIQALKAVYADTPIIGFIRGNGIMTANYLSHTLVDGIGCDTAMPLSFVAARLSGRAVVQGNLDPLLLAIGGNAMDRRVDEILTALAPNPFIFNLGHGIVPETSPANVARLVERVRRWR